ncbi:hypothetical protein Q73A0000_04285 [Kaistella flava (ex Peng et al. 2021)]|uniref:Uncharacterized protein n=2 Tax=Kaistella flava (ex Peng et al. 2021) TaxID=2038776 RepID=A0A7M2YE18_9FLAO|nr:hypothetical protein Q73A0000_04285 [Kaistella flava (ex Peng et al. 2021)]
MKNLTLLLLLISASAFSQMPNISNVWMNNSQPYIGTISAEKMPIKLRILTSEQDKKNDQEYFVSGFTLVDKTHTNFEGKLKITKYKPGKKRNTVFGEYELAEEDKGKHSGILKGKFIYTFIWNKTTEKIDQQFIEFIGDWKSYDGILNYPTNWKKQ